MSELTRSRLYLVVTALIAIALVLMITIEPVTIDRAQAIGSKIKCPVCQGESIADSPADMAQDMMALVAQRVEAGFSEDEIIEEVLAGYSGALLLDPELSWTNIGLWAIPLLVFIGGLTLIYWWRRQSGSELPTTKGPPRRSRVIWGAAILTFAIVAVIAIAGQFLTEGASTNVGVAAGLDGQSLADVSNETMEAVIAANSDDPQVAGMRLALAERYFVVGDFSSAFPHYFTVAESPTAAASEKVLALVRLGWMTFLGNGEVDTASGLIAQALVLDPSSTLALYFDAKLSWCTTGHPGEAISIFESILGRTDLDEDARLTIQDDLGRARSQGSCL